MVDERDSDSQSFNAGDSLKKYTVSQLFKTLDDACRKQERISDDSFETSFTTRLNLVKGFLWKYTHQELKDKINNLYDEMEKEFEKIDKSTLNQDNKILNKQNVCYKYNIEVFKILAVVLTNSPISSEMVEMRIKTEDFPKLIDRIRQPKHIKLFSEVEHGEVS